MEDAMTRTITIEAPDSPDLPVDLQVVQEAGAGWNGETIELTWNVVLAGRYEILRAPITTGEAQLLLDRLQAALQAQTHARTNSSARLARLIAAVPITERAACVMTRVMGS